MIKLNESSLVAVVGSILRHDRKQNESFPMVANWQWWDQWRHDRKVWVLPMVAVMWWDQLRHDQKEWVLPSSGGNGGINVEIWLSRILPNGGINWDIKKNSWDFSNGGNGGINSSRHMSFKKNAPLLCGGNGGNNWDMIKQNESSPVVAQVRSILRHGQAEYESWPMGAMVGSIEILSRISLPK